jgi:hypothetical protein
MDEYPWSILAPFPNVISKVTPMSVATWRKESKIIELRNEKGGSGWRGEINLENEKKH